MIKLLIWDIDGTLITVKRAGRMAMEEAFFNMFNVENAFEHISMSGRLDSMIFRDAVNYHKCADLRELSVEPAFYKLYGGILKNLLGDSIRGEIFPGIPQILEKTHEKDDIINSIGTGNCSIGSQIKLGSLGLNSFFKYGAYGEEFFERGKLIKGAIEKVEKSIQTELLPENIYVIGDTVHDINAARYAGVKAIAVSTGSESSDILEQMKPDYLFEDFSDYEKLLSVF